MIFTDSITIVNGRPWGHGAVEYRGPLLKGFVHPCCNRKALKDEGQLVYADGGAVCWKCAKAWCDANYVPKPVELPEGQAKLFGAA